MSLLDVMPEFLSQLAEIKRGTEAVAATGQSNKYFATIAENVPCNLQVQRGQFTRADFGDNPASMAIVFFSLDTDVLPGDRMTIEGLIWLVDVVNTPRDADGDHLEVAVHLITVATS